MIYRRTISLPLRKKIYKFRKGIIKDTKTLLLNFDKLYRERKSRLRNLEGVFSGNRCFIMGNGPSLNKMDLSLFENEYVWGSNRCYLLFDQIKWRPKFYIAVDKRVVPDNAEEINNLRFILKDSFLFFPSIFRYNKVIKSSEKVYWFDEHTLNDENLPYSMFSLDPAEFLYTVRTVTISALQLAVYFGFNPIYLIGCDTNYTVPKNVIFENDNKDLIISTKDDPNHFHKDYFGNGKKWHEPHVDRMIINYEQSKKVCDEINVQVYDATVDGKLQVFPKINYLDLFK